MTTNKQADKTLAEDQAFIQSLYDDLASSDYRDEAEQPSGQLEQRILAAAKQEVETHLDEKMAAVTSDNIKPLKRSAKKSKHSVWFYPATMAASVLLMVTVINQQLDTHIQAEFEAPLASPAASETFSAAAPQAKSAIAPQASADMLSEAAPMQLSALQMEREADIAAQSQMLAKNELAAKQRLAKQALSKKAKVQQDSSNLVKLRINPALSASELTYKEYAELQTQSAQKRLYWLLKQEDESSYLIELWLTDTSSRYYRLNKNSFQLNSTPPFEAKAFAEITYLPTNKSK